MAMDAAFTQLGTVLDRIADRLVQDPRPAFHTRFQNEADFIPAHSKAEALIQEETRHKHQMQYQHVDWQMVTPKPTVASEPKRISNLTTVTALKSLPNSAITWCNENAFDISVCNAQKNIELWARQFPGEVIQMVMKGTYDDAVRGDSSYSRRYDHIVDITQRAEPDWSTGSERWTHHGIEYSVTRAFLAKLDLALKSPNGMRGSPWDSIHPRDAAYPVHAPSPEYNDLGCYDANGPAVIPDSPQQILHNPIEGFARLVESLPPYVRQHTTPDGTVVPEVDGYNAAFGAFHPTNIRFYGLDTPVPYLRVGTVFRDIVTLNDAMGITGLRPQHEIDALMPVYIINDPSLPPPCPCDSTGKPLITFEGTTPTQLDPFPDFLLLRKSNSVRKEGIAAWWKQWHEQHPYRAQPPVYVQYNSEYIPERAITRHEFNVFDLVLGTLLKTFAEKKKVRAYDLDCIERIRKLKPSRSYTKDIIDELLREYPEDTTTIVSNYQRLFERAHDVFDGERMLPHYLINYLNDINLAIEEIGKPSDVFTKARLYEVFKVAYEDAYIILSDTQRNDDFFRENNKLAKRMRRIDDYPATDRLCVIIRGGMEKIYQHLLELASEHGIHAERPAALTFIPHGSPAQAEYNHMLDYEDHLRATYDASGDSKLEQLIQDLDISDEQAHLLRANAPQLRPDRPRLVGSGIAASARALGGTTDRPPRDAARGRGGRGRGTGRGREGRGMAARARQEPYWGAPSIRHPHAGGGRDDRERDNRRAQLRKLLATHVPPPLTSQAAVVPATASSKPASDRAPFPRKDSGKLVFPMAEYRTMNDLRKAYEQVDASSITDPKIKNLLSAASGVAGLLKLGDTENPDTASAQDARSVSFTDDSTHRELSAFDKAIEDVMSLTDTPDYDLAQLTDAFQQSYRQHAAGDLRAQENHHMLRIDDHTYYEHTSVTDFHVEHCMAMSAGTQTSVVLFDSCATRCFEKDIERCIPGTYMELRIKPLIRQASASTTGQGIALRRFNIPIDSANIADARKIANIPMSDRTKIVVTFIAPVLIAPSFTESISIASMNELAHLRALIVGRMPPATPLLSIVGDHGEPMASAEMQLTPSGMPFYLSMTDEIVEREGFTRVNTNLDSYDDGFALDQILKNRGSLLTHHLMHENLKTAYANFLDSSSKSFAPGHPGYIVAADTSDCLRAIADASESEAFYHVPVEEHTHAKPPPQNRLVLLGTVYDPG